VELAEGACRLREQPTKLLDRLRLGVVLGEILVDELRQGQRGRRAVRSPEPLRRRLALARGSGLDRVADVGPGVEPAHDVQARRFDDLLERAACFDREADGAAADGQARYALRSLRGKEEGCGRADIRADDVRSPEAPLVDQAGQKRSRGVRSDQRSS